MMTQEPAAKLPTLGDHTDTIAVAHEYTYALNEAAMMCLDDLARVAKVINIPAREIDLARSLLTLQACQLDIIKDTSSEIANRRFGA